MNSQQRQIASLKKQKSYAWAKYYESMNETHQQYITIYQQYTSEHVKEALPPHIASEFGEMAEQLRRKIECPICYEVIPSTDLKISKCGHKYCGECFNHSQLEKCAICRRKL